MQMEQLDLEIRSKIYNYTKKILRKYQKGITTGKLTADKFVENIISSGDINDILDEKIRIYTTTEGLSVAEFRELLKYYPIQHLSKLEKALG